MGSVGAALDLQHDGAVYKAVENGHGQKGGAELVVCAKDDRRFP
jgi:hypothetical protein